MKFTKTIAAALFVAVTATSAMAAGGYASLEYSDESNRLTGAENINHGLVIGSKMGTVDYSIKMANSQTEIGSGSITQALEVRAKKNFGAVYFGGRLGERMTSSTHFSYYAIDSGVKFPLVAGFTADVGARYRNAFESGKLYETVRGHVAVGYALTKQDAVAVRWSRSSGDEEKDAVRLQYTRSF
jgi:hypothetical protein